MQNASLKNLLLRLWRHFSYRRKLQFVFIFLATIVASVAELVSIGAIIPFLGVLTAPKELLSQPILEPIWFVLGITDAEDLLLPVTAIFSGLVVISALLRFCLMVMQTRFGHAVGADLGLSIYRRTLHQPYSVHLSRNSSEVIAGVTRKVEMLVYDTVAPFLLLMSSLVLLICVFSALVFINPLAALGGILGLFFIYGTVILLSKSAVLKSSVILNATLNTMVKVLQEGLGGIRDVLIDGSQEIYADAYRTADRRLRRAQGNVTIISGAPRFGIEAIATVVLAVIAYSLSGSSGGLLAAIPLLGGFALAAQRCLPAAQQFYASFTRIRGSQAQLVDSLAFLDQPLSTDHAKGRQDALPFNKLITLNEITFRHSLDSPEIISGGLNLEVEKGSRIGFIGETGSGKSTLMDIIMGLCTPTTGSLEVDGVAITERNVRLWMLHIAHVPQSIFLSDSTIAENIAFGVPKAEIDHARVERAAKTAQISQTIESLPEKYETNVGERGVRLSGGQRQRLGIARAIYKNSDVIVFDESTSALDGDTEQAVMEAIRSLRSDLTIFMVAHRLSTLKDCSQIVELKGGKIVRIGAYESIVRKAP